MNAYDIIQVILFLVVLLILSPLLGRYMARVFLDENHVLKSIVNPFEKTIYRLISCKAEEMDWKRYAYSLLVFNMLGFTFLFVLQLSQSYLPLNPQKLSAPSWSLAFNTSISFVTNTNWQSYSGETTLNCLVQMVGLTVQNLLSAATGIAVFLAIIRGLVAMFNIMLGEVIFGGVGAGIYGMIMFIILTVFIAGLMVGRSPEFFGKKIEAFEVRMAILAILAPNFVILLFSAFSSLTTAGLSGLNNPGPHGLSEILYCFSSAAGNNGSAFAGLNTNTSYYNILTGLGMLIGRFGVIIPVLAVAGNMANKKITPLSVGTFRTDTWLFGMLLIAVILIVGGLTFFPVLSLGPLVEHLLLIK